MINIVITGFMGSGKSTIGKRIAERLKMDHLDTDNLIERKESLAISEIFEKFGERYFRKVEAEIVESIKGRTNTVISTGGKTLLFKKNLDLIKKRGVIITLLVDPEILWRRLANDRKRPLLKDLSKEKFMELYRRRASLYEKLPNKIDISELDERDATEKILKFLTDKKGEIDVKVGEKISKIIFKRFLLKDLKDIIEDSRKTFLICDENVFKVYFRYLKNFPFYYLIPGRDRSKNLKNVEKIWRWLLKERIKGDSVIVSIGGGVIGDLCGFVSSTILRGVSHYHIPTTLLSMLDSSIGGKNGINFNSIKNAIGTFYPPEKVFIDPVILFTLPEKEIASGLVEGIKAGLIGDSKIIDLIEENIPLLKTGDLELFEEIILRAIIVKKRIVEMDPYEKSIRKILNLGHTLGHAIESYYGYKIRHGEAVGIGLIYSLKISEELGLCSPDIRNRVENLLKKLGLKIRIKGRKEDILEFIRRDKKSTENGINFVLLKEYEKPVLINGISEKILLDSMKEVIDENPCY